MTFKQGEGVSETNRQPIDVSDNDVAAIVGGREYKVVPASTTATLGAAGAVGDNLVGLLVIPGTTSPGAVSIKDGNGAAITIFAGGANSVSGLIPFGVPLGITSVSGRWQVITGANVTVMAVGDFT